MYADIKYDILIIGITEESLDNLSIKQVVSAYRKQALKVHPDKMPQNATEEDIKEATDSFKKLNEAYQRLLKYLIEKEQQDKEHRDENLKDDEDSVDDDELFMKESV